MVTTQRHKVFVSYHHCYDEEYKKVFCDVLGSDIVDKSVEDGDIDINLQTNTIRQKIRDEFIADATVTVVLIGKCTWQRKHVDWEIGSSLRKTRNNPRCGLLGILLPTHYDYGADECRRELIPPRLADNCSGSDPFGEIYDWPYPWDTDYVRNLVHCAYQRRFSKTPNNGRQQFARNRSGSCSDGWSD